MEDNKLIQERIKKLNELKEKGINCYTQKIELTANSRIIKEKYSDLEKGQSVADTYAVAGRIMTRRDMGKASFYTLQDELGQIQIYLRQDDIGQENYENLRLLDIGDIIASTGFVFRTKMGELTIHAKEYKLLTKSIRPLPEKFHGIQDIELKYRKRYLDLIMSQETKETFKKRALLITEVRNYLNSKDFLEVETPTLQVTYGGASAKPFITHLNALDLDVFLQISPELYLKRLVVGGYDRVYTICKNYRNEDMDPTHNPEFTMLEFYHAYATYETLMQMSEELVPKLILKLKGSYKIICDGEELDFTPPFKRITFKDLIFNETGIDIDKTRDFEALKKEIISKKLANVNLHDAKHYGQLMDELYKRVARPKIKQPTFLTHYPVEMIALAKRSEQDPTKINSFQLLVMGAELIKAYDELNDPIDQRSRFEEQQTLLKKGDDEAMPYDEDFVQALEIGMPPTAGFGMGIDRLLMTLIGKDSVRDVILFPTMKPEVKSDESDNEKKNE